MGWALAAAGAAPAAQPTRFTLWAPWGGEEDFVDLKVDGEAVRAALGAPTPWRVVLAFDRLLAEPLAFRNAAVHLAGEAEALTRLGPVEIVVVDEDVRSALPPTREPRALDEALGWLRLREVVEDPRGELREMLARELAAADLDAEERAELVREALAEEAALVRASLDALLRWAAEGDRETPGLLLLATGELAPPAALLEVAGGPAALPDGWPGAEEVGEALSALGWTVVPFTPADAADALIASGEEEEPTEEAAAEAELEEEAEGAIAGTSTGEAEAVRLDPGRLREALRRRKEDRSPAAAADPALATLARVTGGRVALAAAELAPTLAELAAWRPALWSQAPGLYRVEGTGPGGPVARLVASGSPPALAAARVRGAFVGADGLDDGEVEIGALAARVGDGVRVEIEAAADGFGGEPPEILRLTVGVEQGDGSVRIEQREVGAVPDGALHWSLVVPAAAEAPAVVALVDSGEAPVWGATFAGWLGGAAAAATLPADALLLPAARPVRLVAPGESVLVGAVAFQAVVTDPSTTRVEYLVDGELRASAAAPPFAATLELGDLPRVQRVEAVAYDRSGRELGRDAVLVNAASGAFLVTLATPGRERSPSGVVAAAGSLPVEVEVVAPAGRPVARVELYWGDRLVATRTAAPFSDTIAIPPEAPQGFVRAVATLVDGSAAEDVLFVNTPGASESLEVTLVQLLVVVTDRDGRPTLGLDREDFRVEEEGARREIASFSDASELPLTLGLAVDTSASMFVKLPDVRTAAAGFLREVLVEDDRAFVVGFGGEPRLALAATGDLRRLTSSVERLQAEGRTAIWKGIVTSLVHLQGVPGMKALIVYSDGADEDPDFSYRTALRFARLVGVPIYVVLTNNEIVRTEGKGLQVRGFIGRLEELVGQVGGRVVLTRVGEDLRQIYAEIARELRSQYVLGYYADRTATGEWHQVEVEVTRPDLTARAPAGYWH